MFYVKVIFYNIINIIVASTIDFLEYVIENISGVGFVTYKKMFGEYGVYLDGKFIAIIADNQFMIKPTPEVKVLLREVNEVAPYPGAKGYFLMEDLEDRDYLSMLLRKTYEVLPEPKLKEKKKHKK